MIARGVALALFGLAASPAGFAQSMFRGDAAHSGVYASQGPRQFHRVLWTFTTGERIVSSPVYADGTIFFGSDDGSIYAVDAASGQQLWRRATGGPVAGSPAVAEAPST